MAKRKHDRDDEPDLEARSNTTSGGEETTPAEGRASAEGAEGTAVYPPPASDRSGERTANVPPAKQLPPDVPPEENPPARDRPPTVSGAIAATEARLAELEAENAEMRRELGRDRPKAAGPTARRAVAIEGRGSDVVEYPEPADGDHDRAAVEAYKAKHGIFHLPSQPRVSEAPGDRPDGR